MSSSNKVLEVENIYSSDSLAYNIGNKWLSWTQARGEWLEEKKEIRAYVFATDTSKTTNAKDGWTNTTTLPKLCQIRDNLHANYYAALFSSEKFMRFDQYTGEEGDHQKAKAIQAYMENKLREADFRTTISQCLYDYIDNGIALGDVEYVDEILTTADGETIAGFVGPRVVRVSPFDHVFDPTASTYVSAPKITRYVKSLGELKSEAEDKPELKYNLEAIAQMENIRSELSGYSSDDIYKATGLIIDGFGDLNEYLQSPMVELLMFEGDIHDMDGNLLRRQKIIVMDRTKVIYQEDLPSWYGTSLKRAVSWRKRPDNLYGMGALDNLVGMQYRLDHIENLKADLFDLVAFPPIEVKGNDVQEFEWKPGEIIFTGEDGAVNLLNVDTGVLNYNFEINALQQQMEELAGAPKQAMGIRTAGEKTAYEVQSLENAAGRIFQDKINQFEIEFLEPLLNNMLEIARRNLNGADTVRVMDNDLGVEAFMSITKEDITAKGKIRAIGARFFVERAQTVQNLTNFFNSAIGSDPAIKNHFSTEAMAFMIEDLFDLKRYGLVQPNVRIEEAADTMRLQSQLQEDLQIESQTEEEAIDE